LQDQINQDLKQAMLARDKDRTETLKMIKSALQMAALDAKDGFGDEQAVAVLKKESKKRAEAAEMFTKGGNDEKAADELAEKAIIDTYLPEQMSEEAIAEIVDQAIAEVGKENMGQLMGAVMKRVGGQADGGLVSKIVREKIQ
jgi:uncharacterized protein YqeY